MENREHDADAIRGGPNGRLSLTQARQNFAAFGAYEVRMLSHVRDPVRPRLHREQQEKARKRAGET